MGAPKITDKPQVVRWIRQGKSNVEIVALLKEHQHVTMTPQAIAVFKSRQGMEMDTTRRRSATMPWALKQEHASLYVPKMLRAEARIRKGEVLPEGNIRGDLERWKKRLESGDLAGMVVHYEPDHPNVFVYVPRREGIDTDLWRDPTKDDDGNPIE